MLYVNCIQFDILILFISTNSASYHKESLLFWPIFSGFHVIAGEDFLGFGTIQHKTSADEGWKRGFGSTGGKWPRCKAIDS